MILILIGLKVIRCHSPPRPGRLQQLVALALDHHARLAQRGIVHGAAQGLGVCRFGGLGQRGVVHGAAQAGVCGFGAAEGRDGQQRTRMRACMCACVCVYVRARAMHIPCNAGSTLVCCPRCCMDGVTKPSLATIAIGSDGDGASGIRRAGAGWAGPDRMAACRGMGMGMPSLVPCEDSEPAGQ